jgi:hypothetical protein
MKNNKFSISKLVGVFICFPLLLMGQSDSLTELQWKQYARAHYAAASVNHEALKQALDNEYSHVVDSLAMLDIFSPLVYKGHTLRAGMERFVLNGTQKYFFPSGKVCAEINYKNNKLHGYAIMYYSNGSIYKMAGRLLIIQVVLFIPAHCSEMTFLLAIPYFTLPAQFL